MTPFVTTEVHQSEAQFDYNLHEIGNRVRVCRWT